ncbi:hypothetical protein Scep_029761 [Stephania cephalantha]|uniref:Plastocyanin-like domain-containing protein n=1 Tax=Stephania cephalantha TaxID=152367 RepID=A0AAP0DYB1_9MAGN
MNCRITIRAPCRLVYRLGAQGSCDIAFLRTVIGALYGLVYRLGVQGGCDIVFITKWDEFTIVNSLDYTLRLISWIITHLIIIGVLDSVGYRFTVVDIDAAYTNPYKTDVLILAPEQTTYVLKTTNQPPGNYYMAAHTYSTFAAPFNDTVTITLLHYATVAPQVPPLLNIIDTPATATPQMQPLLNVTDTPTAHRLPTSLTGLTTSPFWSPPNG